MNKLFIKNMVCHRCVLAVENELNRLKLKPVSVILGEAVVETEPDAVTLEKLRENLRAIGFELIDDKKSRLVEQIKTEIINYVHYDKDEEKHINFSDHLARILHHEYSYLSNLFSSVVGTTIEKYTILQRIERVKELLVYDELTLSEIAWKTGYSSVQHLSNQFKKVIGMSPTAYKKMQIHNRKALDKIGENGLPEE
ncbi:helix-turn-helix domain-containing protein [Candidatus Sulfidibacterium hydrothermale]|uniref:AraC family transcriptional regulator n=1 Tax=Candidatus Sulfidibacterium hydrothermale TaxID=2875962 RepID=UPI001F0ACFC9|nr:AraC family transcriptional regulator [Candidatus Sulfidibacterium hydrothermale]UBM61205.1 helix-turn-helix domain-containing protein [Candidatus Sulfidibacterium hydrothermale]